ncbi:hypothetical protein TNIN_114961 [Trichonephila inaurata madagascariensis]|uniref:Uncharacterized protein n=1 Tax=Trichonephila inaurata madagascariensis TaxID=2747483 RepID=A0A8X6MHD9_9ARAC|nr:hypothetical protein TNIN_114961 [Trichonephila inaurata madagascariensis]
MLYRIKVCLVTPSSTDPEIIIYKPKPECTSVKAHKVVLRTICPQKSSPMGFKMSSLDLRTVKLIVKRKEATCSINRIKQTFCLVDEPYYTETSPSKGNEEIHPETGTRSGKKVRFAVPFKSHRRFDSCGSVADGLLGEELNVFALDRVNDIETIT